MVFRYPLVIQNLEVLNISKNKFVTLDSFKFFTFAKLMFLKANNNMIRKVSSICHLLNLRDLDLSSNRIKTIDA